jgi:hypothetical protein
MRNNFADASKIAGGSNCSHIYLHLNAYQMSKYVISLFTHKNRGGEWLCYKVVLNKVGDTMENDVANFEVQLYVKI